MLFNYNTLRVELNTKHRGISVLLDRPEHQNAINREMLFELETMFSWLTSHVEINYVLISSTSDYFSSGIDEEELRNIDEEKFKQYLLRLQKVVYGSFHLPQTIICDMQSGCSGLGIELTLSADMRFAHQDANMTFNFLHTGIVPTCGLVGILSKIVGEGFARKWIMGNSIVGSTDLLQSGFISVIYGDKPPSPVDECIESIAGQSPVTRIQTKRSILESILPEITRSMQYEPLFSFSALRSGDWKKALSQKRDTEEVKYTTAKEMIDIIGNSGGDHN